MNIRYRCIVADPPWDYGKNKMSGTLGPGSGPMKHNKLHYATMSVDEICALPVPALAEDDSHLYLWTTQTFLRETYRVLDAWGFRQGAILVWAKLPKGVVGTYVCSVEFCIFARRGNLAHKRRQLGTCYQWPRSGHSAKPEAFQDMVESVSPGPYLELFARRQRLGWHSWGNQALCHVSMNEKNTAPPMSADNADCPTCAGGEAARLYREQQACEHPEHEDGHCLTCGADITDTLVGQAEDAAAARENR